MMKKLFPPLILAACFTSALIAGEIDPRFDGRWVGTETFQFGGGGYSGARNSANSSFSNSGVAVARTAQRQTETVPAILGITDHAKTLGVTKGFAKGRYEVEPEKSAEPNRLCMPAPTATS